MSSVLRLEDQSACQPWEMASFGQALHCVTSTEMAGVNLPTIEQISGIEEQARQEGFSVGHAEGLLAGRQQAALEADRLRSLADAFAAELGRADESISQQALDLSIDLAHALLKSALTIRPERVIPIVKEAVRYLPALQQPALLHLHPDDVVLVKETMGDELAQTGWQLSGDTQLERGGCRVETASNQIDASLPVRWQRLVGALGKESDWLEG